MPRYVKPYWTTSDKKLVKLYQGDVVDVLKKLPDQSVHCCITSPPYFGLRDYGTAEWEGGDEECDHLQPMGVPRSERRKEHETSGVSRGGSTHDAQERKQYVGKCKKCGAKRIDQQIGSEQTPDEFVAKMVEVFGEIRRVLRDDGTVWLNLGSSYGSNGQMVATPWMVALALQSDGWILRQDIIWSKPSPMPESVRNRCTKSHEYIFLLAKKQGYFYDAEAIRETNADPNRTNYKPGRRTFGENPDRNDNDLFERMGDWTKNGRNKRSVWNIASESYPGSHFATFPRKLITPCILAGTSEKGCCSKCGAPWKRVVETTQLKLDNQERSGITHGGTSQNTGAGSKVGGFHELPRTSRVDKTTGWEPGCDCDAKIIPCTVLDPFIGSGTACCVSLANGRRSIGIDLSEAYLKNNAIPRIEGELMSRPALSHLTGKKAKRVDVGEEI